MKKLLLFFFISFSLVNAQTWERMLNNTFPPLSDIDFNTENIGWICGGDVVARTADAGMTWMTLDNFPHEFSSAYSLFFINQDKGFVGTSKDTIFITTDGGDSWQAIGVSNNNLPVRGIYFKDDMQTGWVLETSSASHLGVILKTTDGGSSWEEQLSLTTEIQSISFSSPGHGVITGKNLTLFYMNDGENWQVSNPPNLPPVYTRTDIRGVSMANDNIAYAVGWGSRAAGLQPSILLKSTDGGASWTYLQQEPENRQYVNLYAVIALDENTAIAGGGAAYEGSVIIKTTDGGANWYRVNAPFGFSIKAFSKADNRIWATGSAGIAIYSDDNGENWEMTPQIPSTSPYASFYDGNNMMVIGGYGGVVIFSTDGGNSWNASYASDNNVCPNIHDIYFLNSSVGYLARSNQVVSKTTDGGLTWVNIMDDTTSTKVNNYGVQFLNENVGYVVGKKGSHVSAFYKTADGGVTWTEQIGVLSEQLNDLYFFNENSGIVVGNNLLIAYTEDGGVTWNNATVNGAVDAENDIEKVFFYDNQNGLATGDETFVTTDGGRTWEKVNTGDYENEMKYCEMLNPEHWILVGRKNVLETQDGGNTWNDIADLSVISATQLYSGWADKNGFFWVTGGTSEIYKTVNPVKVEEEAEKAADFTLFQNYPNPFNPSTSIKFSIPVSGKVSLKVYDILGSEIAILINKNMEKGVYKVSFNASQLSSGVYFYKLEETTDFSNFSSIKKMILIK